MHKMRRGKKIVSKVVERTNAPKMMNSRIVKNEVPALIENYGIAIHNGREAMKLPLKVLAEMISEKETLLLRIEQEKTMPSTELTKKLEKALGIKLTDVQQPDGDNKARIGRVENATLGDFMTRREK